MLDSQSIFLVLFSFSLDNFSDEILVNIGDYLGKNKNIIEARKDINNLSLVNKHFKEIARTIKKNNPDIQGYFVAKDQWIALNVLLPQDQAQKKNHPLWKYEFKKWNDENWLDEIKKMRDRRFIRDDCNVSLDVVINNDKRFLIENAPERRSAFNLKINPLFNYQDYGSHHLLRFNPYLAVVNKFKIIPTRFIKLNYNFPDSLKNAYNMRIDFINAHQKSNGLLDLPKDYQIPLISEKVIIADGVLGYQHLIVEDFNKVWGIQKKSEISDKESCWLTGSN